nr:hypothetical protein [Tanacetum cinerariifolium]
MWEINLIKMMKKACWYRCCGR